MASESVISVQDLVESAKFSMPPVSKYLIDRDLVGLQMLLGHLSIIPWIHREDMNEFDRNR
jgi:hypothetical protein